MPASLSIEKEAQVVGKEGGVRSWAGRSQYILCGIFTLDYFADSEVAVVWVKWIRSANGLNIYCFGHQALSI